MLALAQFPEGKRIISFNSRVFDEAEQKMLTPHRELCGIVSALQTYEHYIIGSPFPNYIYCDHQPILFLWGRKGQLSYGLFRFQAIITKFHTLKTIWTPGSYLAFLDNLSRNVTLERYQKHQLQHEKTPQDYEFFDKNGNPVFYKIQHEDNPHDTCNDFYPIHRQHGNDEKFLRLQNDGESYTLNSISNIFPNWSIQSAADCFRMGKTINHFRRLRYPLSYSRILHENSDPTYSSISFEEAECETLNVVTVPTDQTEVDEEEDEDDHSSRVVSRSGGGGGGPYVLR